MLRSAQEFIEEYDPNEEYTSYYHESDIEQMINQARKEALEKAKELMGTEFDKAIIDKLISEIK